LTDVLTAVVALRGAVVILGVVLTVVLVAAVAAGLSALSKMATFVATTSSKLGVGVDVAVTVGLAISVATAAATLIAVGVGAGAWAAAAGVIFATCVCRALNCFSSAPHPVRNRAATAIAAMSASNFLDILHLRAILLLVRAPACVT